MSLLLAASPPGTRRFSLDKQAQAIHVELKRSGHRDRFDLVTRWVANSLDLLREVREPKPTISLSLLLVDFYVDRGSRYRQQMGQVVCAKGLESELRFAK